MTSANTHAIVHISRNGASQTPCIIKIVALFVVDMNPYVTAMMPIATTPMIAFLRSKGYTVLNMLEIRRPWTGETPMAKVRVNDTEFDY